MSLLSVFADVLDPDPPAFSSEVDIEPLVWPWLLDESAHIGQYRSNPKKGCEASKREAKYSITAGTPCRVRRRSDDKWTEHKTTKHLSFDHAVDENSTWLVFRTISWYLAVERSRVR